MININYKINMQKNAAFTGLKKVNEVIDNPENKELLLKKIAPPLIVGTTAVIPPVIMAFFKGLDVFLDAGGALLLSGLVLLSAGINNLRKLK